MREITIMAAIAAALFTPVVAGAQDARQILDTVQRKQIERWDGVNSYVVSQNVLGTSTDSWFERTEFTDSTGKMHTAFLPVSRQRVTSGECLGGTQMTPDQLDAFATASEMTGEATATGIEQGLEDAGLPRGLLAASGSDPSATFNPRVIMGSNAQFIRAAADARRQEADFDPASEGQQVANQMAMFADRASLAGTETIDGRSAHHLRADGLDHVQAVEGGEYHTEAISLWIDTEHHVPLRMKVDGTMTSGTETRPVTIESLLSDYRPVPDSGMYESFRQVTRIAGVMTPAQEAEMREAQARMAEFEKQLAGMPASQRQMMESMMGPQLDMMRQMAGGGGFQVETRVTSIRVNPMSGAGDGSDCPAAVTAPVGATRDSVGESATMGAALPVLAPGDVPVRERDPAELQAAQQACLQARMAATQATQKKKRGFGKLLSGVSRLAGQTGNTSLLSTTHEVYRAGATADDFAQAAEDLGLTPDDVAACQDPA